MYVRVGIALSLLISASVCLSVSVTIRYRNRIFPELPRTLDQNVGDLFLMHLSTQSIEFCYGKLHNDDLLAYYTRPSGFSCVSLCRRLHALNSIGFNVTLIVPQLLSTIDSVS